MNILGVYLINQIRTGGDRDYLELLESLAQRGNRVFVIINTCLNYTPKYFTRIDLRVVYKRHGFPPASTLFRASIKKNIAVIRGAVDSSPLDFIHIHGDIYLKSALFLKKKLQVPLFYASRCNDIDRAHILRAHKAYSSRKDYLFSLLYESINRFREQQIAKHADLITFLNSDDCGRFLARTKSDASKTCVIPNHIGPPRCTSENQNKNKSTQVRNIVYVGAVSPAKGLWDLLKAAAILKERGYSMLRYYILGRLESAEPTVGLIKKLNISDIVSLEGYKDPFPYFTRCDLFVYPTLYDSFGNVVTEALHAGCPVIASRAGGIPDILKYSALMFECGIGGGVQQYNCGPDRRMRSGQRALSIYPFALRPAGKTFLLRLGGTLRGGHEGVYGGAS